MQFGDDFFLFAFFSHETLGIPNPSPLEPKKLGYIPAFRVDYFLYGESAISVSEKDGQLGFSGVINFFG